MAKISFNQLVDLFTNTKNDSIKGFFNDLISSKINPNKWMDDSEEEIKFVINELIINTYGDFVIMDAETGEVLQVINLQKYNGEQIKIDPQLNCYCDFYLK